jgi:peptidylprolyl isomerase
LQYRIVREGTGEKPTESDAVKVHYEGKLADGTEFDSSYKRKEPAGFPLQNVIKGWQEGMQLVAAGGQIDLIIPPELGYGEIGNPAIPANSTLYFTVELLEVAHPGGAQNHSQHSKEGNTPMADLDSADPLGPFAGTEGDFQSTDSGLKYRLSKEGGDKPKATDTVEVHYRGQLANGKEFDSSYSRNQTATFPLGGVIPGWTEGLQLVGEGGKIELIIPGDLAYGPRGPQGIPPNATLYFTVELIKIVK